jgi:hypothetical protein
VNVGTTKSEWQERLQRFGKQVRLPSRLSLSGDETALRVVLPEGAASKNMQTDEAAFEAWCLALRRAGARRITLSVRGALGPDGHANRFRHRVARFCALFPDWFGLAPELAVSIADMIPPATVPGGAARWVLNVASKPRNDGGPGRLALNASEHDLELAIMSSPRFREAFGLRYVGRQLPVGVFDGVVTTKKTVFTARKSAIDLWGLARDSDRLVLFELKNDRNVKAGALSELFFYATLMRAVQTGTVRFDDHPRHTGPGYRDIPKTSGVDAFILAPRPHPVLAGDDFSVISTLNAAFAASGEPIRFGVAVVDADGTFHPTVPEAGSGRALAS